MPRFATVLLAAVLATAATAQAVNRTGYLADLLCVRRRTALDGADMLKRPQDHSIHCNLINVCIASGFMILEAPTSLNPTAYGTMWNFTTAANTRAVTWMRTFPETRKNVLVRATGTMSGALFDAQEFTMVYSDTPAPSGSGALSLSPVAAAIAAAVAAVIAF